MEANGLRPNQLVHIELVNKAGKMTRYPSRIEYISGETIVLAAPLKNREPVQIPAGTELSVWFWDQTAIFTFRSTLLHNLLQNIPLIVISSPQKLEKVQNREFVRVKCSINVHLTYESKEGGTCENWCRTRDISGGGMMLVLTKKLPLKIDDEVGLEFQLHNNTVWSKGKIVWNDWELDANGVERNILGIKFSDLPEKSRLTIIKYVYAKQIEMRRKGLI